MTTETVLVTGCAGFIGSTLVDALLADGRDVGGIDAFEPFYSREVKERNLAGARASARFRFAEIDTRDQSRLTDFVQQVKPRTIVDLAARAGVRDSLGNPWLYLDINVGGLENLLTAAASVDATVVFASSSSIYGWKSPLPYREDAVELSPSSVYGATKLAGEALLLAHHRLTGLPVRVARLFTVYGPRQRPDLAVHKFARALVDGQPIPVFDGGIGTRDYTFVNDVVDGLVRLVDAEQPDLTVNLGGGEPHPTIEIVRRLEALFERTANVELLPAQPGDAAHTAADVSRARETIGWAPRTGLDAGLQAFRDWFVAEPAASHQAAASDRI